LTEPQPQAVADLSGLVTREDWERRETEILASYAMRSAETIGRRHPEEEHPLRTVYQRDRDRVVHSTAFRRLEYKTQVFVNHEGDYYRTRLTHTLEVSQISRTIARIMGLNEDLVEAIALAHDLGHTPFGHSGEEELNACMQGHGGFEHNRHGLRVLDYLERPYPEFTGVNLSYEVREAVAKHTTRHDRPGIAEFEDGAQPVLEAQVVEVADEIAYNNHDLDDGLAAGMITTDQLAQLEGWGRAAAALDHQRPDLPAKAPDRQIIIRLINMQVTDLVQHTMGRLRGLVIENVDDVRAAGQRLFAFSDAVARQKQELEAFLYEKVYHHTRVVRMMAKAKRFIHALFEAYESDQRQLPGEQREAVQSEGLERVICDYIAGMTDRCAQDEYMKLFTPYERV